MTGAMELFSLSARLLLDKTGYDNDIKDADSSGKALAENLSTYMDKAKKFITGLGIAAGIKKAASAAWALAKSTSEAGDRIDKQSQALGLSRKAFQEWDYILSQSGASIDSMGMTMKTLTAAISENSAETAAGLSKLGLSAAQLQSMSAEDQFETLVKAFQEMPEGVEKSQLAMQLFGRNAQSLMPLLNSASGSVDELRQRAHDLGLIMSDDDVDASVAFGDALSDLNLAWTAIQQKFGAQMLPTLTKGLISAANALGRVSNAVSEAFSTGDWSGVFDTITEEISNLVPGLIDTVVNIAAGIFENADKIIDLAVSIVEGLTDGIVKALPKLIAKLPEIGRRILQGVLNIGKSLGNGLIDVINGILGTNIPHIDEIRWPTWDEVKEAFNKAWGFIKDGAKKLMILVFGEDENGGIKWPSASEIWEKVETGLSTLWGGIKTLATGILKFVFGEDEDGGIKWPSASEIWDKVETGLSLLWGGIKTLATGILKFVFGESEDGGIEWPTVSELWEKISTGFSMLWDGGDGKGGIRKLIEGAAKWVLGLFGLPEEDQTAVVKFFGDWWSMAKEWIEGVASWVLSLFGFATDGEVTEHFRKWWEGADGNGGIKAMIKQIANWLLGALGLPSVDEIVTQIETWWKEVKSKLVLELIAHFGGVKGVQKELGYDPNAGTTWGQQVTDQYEQMGLPTVNISADDLNNPDSWLYDEHAKGLNYVPYDNYLASLHRGEMVLNQGQSRAFRQGGAGLDFNALYDAVSSAVASAVSDISINMDGKLVGNAVTEQVSRNIYRQQAGRRVALA